MPILNKCPIDLKDIKIIGPKSDYAGPHILYKGKKIKRKASSSRSAFKIGKYCIKTGFDSYSGKSEIKLYKNLKPRDKKHFPKIYAYNIRRGIAIMDFVKVKSGTSNSKAKKILERICKEYDIYDVHSNYNNNWGICKKTGIVKIYDWEMNEYS